MKKSKLLFALSATLSAFQAFADEVELDPCKRPNPVYWDCLAVVRCNTAPIGGTYCGLSEMEFCDHVTDKEKVVEDAAKIAAATAVCYNVPPASKIKKKYSISIAAFQSGVACVGPHQKEFCDVFKKFEEMCPGPKYFDICAMVPWLPKLPVVKVPDPKEYAKKALGEVYKHVTGLFGHHSTHHPYKGEDPAYIRDLTANYVNGTLIAAASDDFTSVGKFVADTVKAHADPADKKPPPNMYLEGLRSAVGKMTAEDVAGLVQAVALAIENAMPQQTMGVQHHTPAPLPHKDVGLWQEIAKANWSNPLAAATALGTHYRSRYPSLRLLGGGSIDISWMAQEDAVMTFAKSLQGSNAGPLGALIVAEFMRAGYKDRLEIGDRLRSYEGIMSPNGKYFLQVPKDGCNLMWYGPGIYAGLQQWRKDWEGNICELVQQGDGNLVLYRKDGKAMWWGSSDPAKVRSSYYATVLQDDGNVVTYDDRHNVLWHSGSFKCKQHVRYWNDAKSDGKYCY